MQAISYDIVIVGAGPTGLALAVELRRLGLAPMILDRQSAGENTSRAAVVHARTLEVLTPLGVVPEMVDRGVIVRTFRVRDRRRILASISFKDLDTQYPFALMCPQDRTEAILLRRLEALGGAVQRPVEVSSVHSSADEVEVRCKGTGREQVMRARWLVGCDGMHSVVRERAGIPFEGSAYEENFVLADVKMDGPLARDEVTLFFSEKGLVVVAPLPEDHFRIVATVAKAPPQPTMADMQHIFEERGPDDARMAIKQVVWSSRFHVQHRVAHTFHQGRILLAGDAAHVHSPAGGQGMNTGIQDAVSLANALHSTLQHKNSNAIADWQACRLDIARSVVSFTDRMTRTATIASPALRAMRNAVIGVVGHIPLAQHAIAQRLAELDNR